MNDLKFKTRETATGDNIVVLQTTLPRIFQLCKDVRLRGLGLKCIWNEN